jgi:hypothetical protein
LKCSHGATRTEDGEQRAGAQLIDLDTPRVSMARYRQRHHHHHRHHPGHLETLCRCRHCWAISLARLTTIVYTKSHDKPSGENTSVSITDWNYLEISFVLWTIPEREGKREEPSTGVRSILGDLFLFSSSAPAS